MQTKTFSWISPIRKNIKSNLTLQQNLILCSVKQNFNPATFHRVGKKRTGPIFYKNSNINIYKKKPKAQSQDTSRKKEATSLKLPSL